MNIRKLLVGAAGLAAAASLIGLGAGASFTDTAIAYQHIQTGTINVQVSTHDGDYGKQATYVADDNVSGYGTGVITEHVYLKNAGSLPAIITPVVTKSGLLPVDFTQLKYTYSASLVDNVTLAAGKTQEFTFTYQVNDLGNGNKGQAALLTVTANGIG